VISELTVFSFSYLGEIDFENDLNSTYEYYWGKNGVIKKEDIDNYEKNYKGSEEEKNDLIDFFEALIT
jgi:hypothetical protein